MNAYWDAVWKIAGLLIVLGVCLAVGGALVIGAWVVVRRLGGVATSPRGVMGTGSMGTGSMGTGSMGAATIASRPRRVRPEHSGSSAGVPGDNGPGDDDLPPPDSMGHTPASALAQRASSAALRH